MKARTQKSDQFLSGVIAGLWLAVAGFPATATEVTGDVNVVNGQVVIGDGVTVGNDAGVVVGNGRRLAKAFPVTTAFHGLELAAVFETTVVCGKAVAVEVCTDENLLPLVEVAVRDGILGVRFTKPVRTQTPPKLTIAVPALDTLRLAGGDVVRVTDVKGNRFQLNQSGSGAVTVAGQVKVFVCTVSGVGEVEAGQLACATAEVTISGVGGVTCRPATKLQATLSGVGGVRCLTRPATVDKTGIGLGEVEFAGD